MTASLLITGCASVEPKVCEFKQKNRIKGVDRDEVDCVVRTSVVPKAKTCYQDFILSGDPRKELKILSVFEISTDGKAEKITLSPDSNNANFGNCLRNAFASAQFPAHGVEDRVKISYPIVFRSQRNETRQE